MSALIDTSALIAGLPAEVISELGDHCSSTIVRGELAHGLHAFRRAGRADRLARREALLDVLDSLPGFWRDFDLAASDAYGALTAEPPGAIRLKDALIAAHALRLDLPVLTCDTGFTRFPAVEVRLIPTAP